MALYTGVFAILLSSLGPLPLRAQEELAHPQADSFFSGNVEDVSADMVSVSRTILGKAPEKHTFKILPTTKVEGKMKQNSRVTVRYATGDEGDVALSIIVRADKPENKKK